MASLFRDLRLALRTLRRGPLITTAAILSLALGIGANTAIFTLMDQLMLRRLPVKDPDQLVMLYQQGYHYGNNMGNRMHSYPLYQELQQKAAPFSEVLCRRLVSGSLSVDNRTERVDAEVVSGNYFTMLGVRPAIGRLFTSAEDDRVTLGHPVVVLSYDYWATRFDRDPWIVGRKILVNNYPMTIVGVSGRGFAGIDPARSPQIRVPVLMSALLMPEWSWFRPEDRRTRWVQIFARLKPGYTAASARAPVQGLFRQIREYESTLPSASAWSVYQRSQFLRGAMEIEKAATGYSNLRNRFSTALVVLMSMVGLVLLIACANVANLLIARAMVRQKEIAVRLAVGASRARLVRQLFAESLVLSSAGGLLGIGLAVALTRGLLAVTPSEGNPLLLRADPDLRLLSFTLALTALTTLVFGLAPALGASRPDLWTTLKDAAGSIAGKGGSLILRKGLVASQVALSFLLLFGAGLFVRSLQNLKTTDTGFRDPGNLVTFQLSPALNGYDAPRTVRFYQDLLERLRAIPGVRSAGLAAMPLLAGDEWDATVSVEGHRPADGEDMRAYMNALSPGYFETMGVPILYGRDFDGRDVTDQSAVAFEGSKVAIVNESFARHYFGAANAVGRHIGFGRTGATFDIEIVGVAANSLYEGPRQGVRRQAFVPNWGRNAATFYVRAGIGSTPLYSAVRNEVKKLDPSMPVFRMKTLAGQLDETLLTERLIAMLSVGFGLLATLLAMIGLYGVMAFAVARRTREMGLRMALGAHPGSVVRLVMKEVLTLLSFGLLIGAPSAIALGRLVAAQLYGIRANDPWTAATTMALLTMVAAAAGLIPALRASRIDPILALRYE